MDELENTGDVVESSAEPVSDAGEEIATSFHELFAESAKSFETQQGESDVSNETNLQEPKQTEPEVETEPETEDPKLTARSSRFKEIEARNQELEASLKQYESLNSYVEQYGEAQNLNTVLEAFSMLMNPAKADDAFQYLTNLPHGNELANRFFHQGLSSIENRVSAVNDVLKNDYGIDTEVDFDTLDLLFTYFAASIADPKAMGDFKAELNEKIGESDFLDKEAMLQKKIETLEAKFQELTEKKNSPDSQNTPEQQEEQKFNSFKQQLDPIQDNLVEKDLLPIAKEFGYEAVEGETPEERDYKNWLLGKIFEDYDRAIAKTDAFSTFIQFLTEGKQDHPLFPVVKESYMRAAKATLRNILKGKSYRKNGVSVTKPTGVKRPELNGRSAISTQSSAPQNETEQSSDSLRSLISQEADRIVQSHA